MKSLLAAIFLALILVANQSFAAICAETCQLASVKTKAQNVNPSASSHDCHSKKSDSDSPEQLPPYQDCDISFCVGTVFQVQPFLDQVKEKDGVKESLIRGELISPERLLFYSQNTLFLYSQPPIPKKLRLHLRLQRLLI